METQQEINNLVEQRLSKLKVFEEAKREAKSANETKKSLQKELDAIDRMLKDKMRMLGG